MVRVCITHSKVYGLGLPITSSSLGPHLALGQDNVQQPLPGGHREALEPRQPYRKVQRGAVADLSIRRCRDEGRGEWIRMSLIEERYVWDIP